MIKKLFVTTAVLGMFGTANAADFSEADALWERRAEGETVINDARALYLAQIDAGSLTDEEMVYATTQIGRLAVYQGDRFYDKDTDEGKEGRKQIFGDCWKTHMPKINPISKDNGESGDRSYGSSTPFALVTPQFFYWQGACMALYGEVSGTAENIINVGRLNWTIRHGLEQDVTYEGGGILRVKAGVVSNAKAKPLGLYNPKEGLELIDVAIAGAPYPGTSVSGADYCENFERKALTLIELERVEDAKALLGETIETIQEAIDFEELPEGRIPETLHCKSELETLVSTL